MCTDSDIGTCHKGTPLLLVLTGSRTMNVYSDFPTTCETFLIETMFREFSGFCEERTLLGVKS